MQLFQKRKPGADLPQTVFSLEALLWIQGCFKRQQYPNQEQLVGVPFI